MHLFLHICVCVCADVCYYYYYYYLPLFYLSETKPSVTSLNGTPAVPASHDQAEPSPESETSHKVTTLVKSGSSQVPSDVMTTCQQPNASMQSSPVVDDGQVEQSLAVEVNVNSEASRCFADIPREDVTRVEKVTSASDSLDTGNSQESRFTEEEPPMIVNLVPQSLNVLIGSDIELRGSFIGTPQPAVKWFVEECRTRTELLPGKNDDDYDDDDVVDVILR